MSEQEPEAPGKALVRRTFAAELSSEGRTLDVRVVPYGITAEVSDDHRTVYREEWAPGCFDDQLVAGHRLKVLLNVEHERGIRGIVGKGISLRSESNGLHGSFEVLRSGAGNTTLELVQDGILDGVSLEALPKKSIRTMNGVVRRVKAHLVNVALCRTPAFPEARVLAVREEVTLDETLLPLQIDPELVERCRRLGIRLPEHLKAHPAESGTPTQMGTPAGGTRQDNPSSLEVSAP
jgi:HK97 family phage prohead protease